MSSLRKDVSARVGLITIGQSPRTDITPIYRRILGPEVELVEIGALDGLTLAQVAELAPLEEDDLLVSRMANGTEVHLSKRALIHRVQDCIDYLDAQSVSPIALLCTGSFPGFRCKGLLVEPQKVVDSVITALAGEGGGVVGVMVPAPEQASLMERNLQALGVEGVVAACSPYVGEENLVQAAQTLAGGSVKFIVMHCVGYTLEMKDVVRRTTGKPVLLANSVVARVLKELLG